MTDHLSCDRDATVVAWIDDHFDEQVAFLRALVQVPTDTPPGDNVRHADAAAEHLAAMGLDVERHAPPVDLVRASGLASIVNLVVRHRFAASGPVIALNAHGDVVPPGNGWTHDPYGGAVVDGWMYGRGVAVSKSDFATYAFALRALQALAASRADGPALGGAIELHLTYDEEVGGLLGPRWLLDQGIVAPDLAIGAGFSYAIVTAHNGCLQLEVTIRGRSAHAAMPDTGVDALRAAVVVMDALYRHGAGLGTRRSTVAGIGAATLNIGRIEGGTNTNVVPDAVVFRLDRRMIPEEDPATVEAELRAFIEGALPTMDGLSIAIERLLMARALAPPPGQQRLVDALTAAAAGTAASPLPVTGSPLYTDARHYAEAGIPIVLYGAGPRSILAANAKRADERLALDDLRMATKVVARALLRLVSGTA